MTLAKVAAIIRKQMFAVGEIFDDDLSQKRQRVLVHIALWQPIQVITGGPIS